MRTVLALMDRNRKLFFKDKGMLFTSMITPVILIVLYATFLAKVFRDSFTAAIPDMITISDKLINGTVAAQNGMLFFQDAGRKKTLIYNLLDKLPKGNLITDLN